MSDCETVQSALDKMVAPDSPLGKLDVLSKEELVKLDLLNRYMANALGVSKQEKAFEMRRASADSLRKKSNSVSTNLRAVENIFFKNEPELESQAQQLLAKGGNPILVRVSKSMALFYSHVNVEARDKMNVEDCLNVLLELHTGSFNEAQLLETERFYTKVASDSGFYKKSPKLAQHLVYSAIFGDITTKPSTSELKPDEIREKETACMIADFYEAATDPERFLYMELPELTESTKLPQAS